MIMDIQPLYEEFSMSKYMNAAHRDENLLITIQTLRAKVASADVLVEELQADNLRLREALKDFEKWIEELPIPTKGASFFYKKLGSLIAEIKGAK